MKIVVTGHPVTEGSVRAFAVNGRAKVVQGGSADRRRRLEDWRHAIREAGEREFAQLDDEMRTALRSGPVSVSVVFGLTRPAAEPKRRRTWPIKARSGDIDKLLRAVLDALTGVVWIDDSQVVEAFAAKDWAEAPGVHVLIFPGEWLGDQLREIVSLAARLADAE